MAWSSPGDLPVELGGYVGPYRLLEVLGRGGFGIVYLAEQVEPVRRRVALKMILLGMDTEAVVARFKAEEQALALMEHPHVAKVFDAGVSANGRPYFVMELVHGVPITEHCDRARLNLGQRMSLFIQVCDAIQHAHHKGVIHRDIKPSNVLVEVTDGQPGVKVIDFGVAKAVSRHLGGETVFTAQGQIIGTPEYMSPEQAESTAQDVDTRTDLYSLGVLLYELLTGTLPFDPKSLRAAGLLEIHRIIREVDPPKPSTRLANLGDDSVASARNRRTIDSSVLERQLRGDLDWITMKAMDKDRDRRYESVSELAADIRRHLKNEPVIAGAPSAGYRLSKFIRRHRTVVTAGLLVALALVTGIIGTTTAAIVAYRAQLEEAKQRTRADRKAAEAERVAYLASVTAASESIRAGELGAATDRLSAAPEIHRGWEWDHLTARRDESLAVVHRGDEAVLALALSGDGRRLAAGDTGGVVRLWDPDDLRLLWEITGHEQQVSSLSFSGDGARLVSGSADFTARTWNVADGRRLALLDGTRDGVFAAACSPDGRHVALSGRNEAVIQIYEVESATRIARLEGHDAFVQGLAFDPAGRRLASAGSDATVRLWSAEDWRPLDTLAGHTESVNDVTFTPDGEILASGSADQSVRLWDVRTGAALATLEPRDGEVHAIAFGPNGERLAVGTNGRRLHVYDVTNRRLLSSLLGHRAVVYAACFDPAGDRLFSAGGDGTIRVWDTEWAEFAGVFRGHEGAVCGVAFRPDGTTFVTAALRTLRIWDADGGRALDRLDAPDILTACAVRRSDGVVAAGDTKGAVRLADAGLERWQSEWTGDHGVVHALAFSPDGALLAAGHHDGAVVVREVATGAVRAMLGAHERAVEGLAFAASRPHLASASRDGAVRVWNVETGAAVSTIPGTGRWLSAVAYSPDDAFIAAAGHDNTITIHDAATGSPTATMAGHTSYIVALVYTPDGKRLLSGSYDRTVRAWDTATFEEVLAMRGHAAEVLALAIAPDGTRAVSGGIDMTARTWDTLSRRERCERRRVTTRPPTPPSAR